MLTGTEKTAAKGKKSGQFQAIRIRGYSLFACLFFVPDILLFNKVLIRSEAQNELQNLIVEHRVP
jgi:hypothetical protein